jgi:tetratricopeptide (TPR) repeat protein
MNNIREIALDKYYSLVATNFSKARNVIEELNYENDAYLLSCIAQTYKDEAIFFKNGNSRKNIDKEKLKLAKLYIDRAFVLNPECRNVLYVKGRIYDNLDEIYESIDCFIKILKAEDHLEDELNCSQSELWVVQMMLNDARFELYRLFYDIQSFEISNKFLKEYKKHLKKGVQTIYTPIEKFLKS